MYILKVFKENKGTPVYFISFWSGILFFLTPNFPIKMNNAVFVWSNSNAKTAIALNTLQGHFLSVPEKLNTIPANFNSFSHLIL